MARAFALSDRHPGTVMASPLLLLGYGKRQLHAALDRHELQLQPITDRRKDLVCS